MPACPVRYEGAADFGEKVGHRALLFPALCRLAELNQYLAECTIFDEFARGPTSVVPAIGR